MSVSEPWSICYWYLNDELFCQQTSANVADGAVIDCLAEGGGVDGGIYDNDQQCKLDFSRFKEQHSGEWYACILQ